MTRALLQDMINDIRFEDLPANWNSSDLRSFSETKKLWDYQEEAVENALKVLWKYYEDFIDYQENENLELNKERKQKFYKWYKDNGLEEKLDINLKKKRELYELLTEYYSPSEDKKFSYENFVNRMSFWMATGSGKTLVIIKLIQILSELIKRGEIPPHDILVLTHRDDLIEQLRKHVDEFNYKKETKLVLKELKEYPEVKRQRMLSGITVFYYRSDNLSDEQKERIIDFRNYDDNGKWYIFLDEAHKGDKEESKRQHIYSILSRNGFLFNFSATFTDLRDIITCAYEFNLSSFIKEGYGKHISLLKQEIRAFRDDEDYGEEEKSKIVLKSLILLTYVKKFYEGTGEGLYHNPLVLTLVNSVNKPDADLKLFFRELEKIGRGDIREEVFKSALDELWEELRQEKDFMFEDGNKMKIDETIYRKIIMRDILKYIYNSDSFGAIEISYRPSDRKQVAFKLTTAERHFVLSKTGDMPKWLKDELSRFNINHQFEKEGFFERINKDDSPINILMGSRTFYEGWDSNRPNVINFINIGMGQSAKKFVRQSIGRGVRIEPVKNKRKRLLSLFNNKEIDEDLFNKIKDKASPLETLFIFGTNRKALGAVIEELKMDEEHLLPIFDINEKAQEYELLVPTYKKKRSYLPDEKIKFPISEENLEVLAKFQEFIADDRIMLMIYNTEPRKISLLRKITMEDSNFRPYEKSCNNIHLLLQRIFDYFSVMPKDFEKLKELEEEINHFRNIKVYLENINDLMELKKKIEVVKEYPTKRKKFEDELSKLSDEARQEFQKLLIKEATETYKYKGKKINIKYVANHYYIPLVLSEDEKVDYIKHIIKIPSEVKFINDLENYLAKSDNKFKEFDWWMFSKIDESLDRVYIPYYNSDTNNISNYYPDFIFWLKKDDEYTIFFVDPKGIKYTSAYPKIDGYKQIFEDTGQEKIFEHNGFKVKLKLLFYSADISGVPTEYRKYWFDNIKTIVELFN